jgi:hypothetical protein
MTIIDSKCTICGFMEDTPNHELGCGAHKHDEECYAALMTRDDGTTFYLGECSCDFINDIRRSQDSRWTVYVACVTTRRSPEEAVAILQDRVLRAGTSALSMDEVAWARSLKPSQ